MRIRKSLLAVLSGIILGSFLAFTLFDNNPRHFTVSYQRTQELGEAIVVEFFSEVSKEKVIASFDTDPHLEGQLYWQEVERKLFFIPRDGFTAGQNYSVSVGGSTAQFLASLIGESELSFTPQNLPTRVLVRTADNPTIYYITEGGLKRPFKNIDIFYSYKGNRLEDVRVITEEVLGLYPDSTLVHLDHDPNIYKLEDGQKRLVKNTDTFMALGLDWGAVAPINFAQFNSYPTGEPLNVIIPPDQIAGKNKSIEIDLDKMIVSLWHDGEIEKSFEVAGKGNPKTYPTREGLFEVKTKEVNHFSGISHVWMPWSMQYSGNYFIHEWPYWPGGTPITSKYSGGCIRLRKGDAKEVFDWAEIGTAVLIH